VATTTHLLVTAVERSEPLVAWWESASPRDLLPREAAGLSTRAGKDYDAAPLGPGLGVSFDALASQAVGSASKWAAERSEAAGAAHLVVVLLDQRSTPVADVLGETGLIASMLRERALALIGLHADHPPVALDPLPPAGTSNRPPSALGPSGRDLGCVCSPPGGTAARATAAALGLGRDHLERAEGCDARRRPLRFGRRPALLTASPPSERGSPSWSSCRAFPDRSAAAGRCTDEAGGQARPRSNQAPAPCCPTRLALLVRQPPRQLAGPVVAPRRPAGIG